jgi:lysyl-tRNA synthetase class 2
LGEDEKVILEILNSQEEPMALAEVKERSQYPVKNGIKLLKL